MVTILFFVAIALSVLVALALLVLGIIFNIKHTKKENPVFALGAALGILLPILYLISPMMLETIKMVGETVVNIAGAAETSMLAAFLVAIPHFLMVVAALVSLVLPTFLFMVAGFAMRWGDKEGDWLSKVAVVGLLCAGIAYLAWTVSPYEIGETFASFNETFSETFKLTLPELVIPSGWMVFYLDSLCPFFVLGFALVCAGVNLIYAIAKKRNIALFILGVIAALVPAILFLLSDITEMMLYSKLEPDAPTTGLISALFVFIPETTTKIRDALNGALLDLGEAVPFLSSVTTFMTDIITGFLAYIIDFTYDSLFAKKTFGFFFELCGFALTALPGTFFFLLGNIIKNPTMQKKGLKIALLFIVSAVVTVFALVLGFLAWTEIDLTLYPLIAAALGLAA